MTATPGQAACVAWNAHYAEEHGIEARNEWAASDTRGRAAWEAAAKAGHEAIAAPELAAAKPDLRTAWRLADERLALLGEILAHPGISQVPAALRATWHKRAGLPS